MCASNDVVSNDSDKDTTTCHFLLERKKNNYCFAYSMNHLYINEPDIQILMMCDLCQLMLGYNIITILKGYY